MKCFLKTDSLFNSVNLLLEIYFIGIQLQCPRTRGKDIYAMLIQWQKTGSVVDAHQ